MMKVAVNVSEEKLYKDIIYQALEDLYAKRTKVKFRRAYAWLFNEFEEGNTPLVTCEEACDFYGVKQELIMVFADAILSGKISKAKFKEAKETE